MPFGIRPFMEALGIPEGKCTSDLVIHARTGELPRVIIGYGLDDVQAERLRELVGMLAQGQSPSGDVLRMIELGPSASASTPSGISGVVDTTTLRMAAIFREWERRYRDDPSGFLNAAERAGLATDDYGIRCALYFRELAHELDRAGALPQPSEMFVDG